MDDIKGRFFEGILEKLCKCISEWIYDVVPWGILQRITDRISGANLWVISGGIDGRFLEEITGVTSEKTHGEMYPWKVF